VRIIAQCRGEFICGHLIILGEARFSGATEVAQEFDIWRGFDRLRLDYSGAGEGGCDLGLAPAALSREM